jgi:hypothetical protein
MGEARDPAEERYRLPEGTYRELIVKLRLTMLVKKRLTAMRDPNKARLQQHTDEQARVKAAADREVAAGRPIVVLAWQVQVTRYAHRLAAAPSWLTTPATATVRVFADDTCEPASF